MYTVKKNNFALLILCLTLLAVSARAQEKDVVKDFLSDSEFGLQRAVIKAGASGQKGLIVNEIEQTTITDIITVDLIDPFANKTIKGTKTELAKLDDDIEFSQEDKVQKQLQDYREKVEEFFAKLESEDSSNAVEILNYLKVNRIVSSPLKYVVIMDKKYKEDDVLKIRVNKFVGVDTFEKMLDDMTLISDASTEDQEVLQELKDDSINRYLDLTENTETALNITKVEISEIQNQQVSFIIDDKVYKLVMKN